MQDKIGEPVNFEQDSSHSDGNMVTETVPSLVKELCSSLRVSPYPYDKNTVRFVGSDSCDEYARYEYAVIYDDSLYGVILWLETHGDSRGKGLARPLRKSMITDMSNCKKVYTRIDNTVMPHIAVEQGFRQISNGTKIDGWYVLER
jgi:hypothetical protein